MKKRLISFLLITAAVAVMPFAAMPSRAAGTNTETGKKAIIVVPGITGSELYTSDDSGEKKIWIGRNLLTLKGLFGDLAMDEHGVSVKNIYTKDESASPYGAATFGGEEGFYKTFVEYLRSAHRDYDVRFFSYDWRGSCEDAAAKLNTFIENGRYDSVILAAHSMGGIVSGCYIDRYGGKKVDKLISLGTPYYGAPKALKAFVTGDFTEAPISMDNTVVRDLIANMPGIYELLPDQYYFLSEKYVYNKETGKYLDYRETVTFMENSMTERHKASESGDSDRDPGWFNSYIFGKAEALHAGLEDTYQKIKSGETDAYIIAGYDISTVSGYEIDNADQLTDVYTTQDGDGTVPLISATLGTASGNERMREPYYVRGVKHLDLVKDERCLRLVKNIIDGYGDTDRYAEGCEGAVSRSGEDPAADPADGRENVYEETTRTDTSEMAGSTAKHGEKGRYAGLLIGVSAGAAVVAVWIAAAMLIRKKRRRK